MESRAFTLLTGLFVIGLVAGIIAWANWLAKEPLERVSYRVVSSVPVTGLNAQAQVRYRGISVGRVAAIGLDPKDARRILISIEVDKGLPLTRGTYAQLGIEGITGIAYVHLLDEGKDPQPAPKAEDGVIELQLKPSFMDAIANHAESALSEARELIASLNALLNSENRNRIATILASHDRLATNLEKITQRMPATLTQAEAWLAEDNRQLARRALERVNQAAEALPELARETRQLVRDTRELVGQIGRLSAEAQSTAGALREETLPRVNALAESVERSAQRVGRLAADLDRQPESVIWGRPALRPGPGESGFE